MYKVNEIYEILAKEDKDLKPYTGHITAKGFWKKTRALFKKMMNPDRKYKVAEEGLLRAFYFFRWLLKKEYADTDKVVEAFLKNKIPEQQMEHYLSALVMIESYETDEKVKNAIRYINDEYKKKTGSDIIDSIKDARLERRLWKNVYGVYNESLENLKARQGKVKVASMKVWIIIAILLLANLILIFTNVYSGIVIYLFPNLAKANPALPTHSAYIIGGILFFIPTVFILISSRMKLAEHGSMGSVYPEEISAMEKRLAEFKKKLEEKKIRVD